MNTQKRDLLNYLQRYGAITRLHAMRELGIMELSSRVGELEREGWTIPRQRINVVARNGRIATVMEYYTPDQMS